MLLTLVAGQLTVMTTSMSVSAHTDLSRENQTVLGGWSEESGRFSNSSDSTYLGRTGFRSARKEGSPHHGGKRENRYGGIHRESRAVGWTSWPNVYHYTRAQMVSGFGFGEADGDSGRVWGMGGTEAYSQWVHEGEIVTHRAKTFFGR